MRLPTKTLTTLVVTWLLDLLRARRSHQKHSWFNLSVGDIRSACGSFPRSAPPLPANFSLGLSVDLSPGRLALVRSHGPPFSRFFATVVSHRVAGTSALLLQCPRQRQRCSTSSISRPSPDLVVPVVTRRSPRCDFFLAENFSPT